MTLQTPVSLSSEDSRAPDLRAAARTAWARAATGDPALEVERASMDAGFRSYWRGHPAAGPHASKSVIVMDSPPDKEAVLPWLEVRSLLQAGDVRVPGVLAEDVEHGFLLLEDLGHQTYLHVVDADNADALFDDAIGQLLKLQQVTAPEGFPAYDEALLARELRLFDEWFLGRHLGVTLDCDDLERLELVYRHLIDAALAQPQVLVHRDFMPRNLMPTSGMLNGSMLNGSMLNDSPPAVDGPAVLDFQDAVLGPIAYDPICLFKDAFLSWPQARIDAWLDRYHARARAAGLPVPALARFRRDADWIGVHRHLKVIGIFARLNYRDAKPKYLADAARFLAYLDGVVPKYPELVPLGELLDRHVRPAFD